MMEDLDIFFSGLDATTATFTLVDGSTRPVTCYYDEPFLDTMIGDSPLNATMTRLTCKSVDLVNVDRESSVIVIDPISGQTLSFSVMQIEPDGNGTSRVVLGHE